MQDFVCFVYSHKTISSTALLWCYQDTISTVTALKKHKDLLQDWYMKCWCFIMVELSCIHFQRYTTVALTYREPQVIFPLFMLCCVLLWLGDRFYSYLSGLFHWHWGNHMIAPVPVKQPWRICVNILGEGIRIDNVTKIKKNITKICAYFMGYTIRITVWWKNALKGIERSSRWLHYHHRRHLKLSNSSPH